METLIGAFAGLGFNAYDYNLARFKFDAGQRIANRHWKQSLRIQQWAVFREDVRDLFQLTIDNLNNSLVKATLIFYYCFWAAAYGAVNFPSEPKWFCIVWGVCTLDGAALALLSAWFAVHGTTIANAGSVKLLTQAIRKPIPTVEETDAAKLDLNAYEADFSKFAQMPNFARIGSLDVEGHSECSGGAAAQRLRCGRRQRVHDRAAKWLLDVSTEDALGLGGGPGRVATLDNHVKLFKQTYLTYAPYDAYARISLSAATHECLLGLGYFMVASRVSRYDEESRPYAESGAGIVALVMTTVISAIVYKLDLYVERFRMRIFRCGVYAGPFFVTIACFSWKSKHLPQIVPLLLVVLTCVCHLVWSVLRLLGARPATDGIQVPLSWRPVRYLDVFDWLSEGSSGSEGLGASQAASNDNNDTPVSFLQMPTLPESNQSFVRLRTGRSAQRQSGGSSDGCGSEAEERGADGRQYTDEDTEDQPVLFETMAKAPGSRYDIAMLPWRFFSQWCACNIILWVLATFWILLGDLVFVANEKHSSPPLVGSRYDDGTQLLDLNLKAVLLSKWQPENFKLRPAAIACAARGVWLGDAIGDVFFVSELWPGQTASRNLGSPVQQLPVSNFTSGWTALINAPHLGLLLLEPDGIHVAELNFAGGKLAAAVTPVRRWAVNSDRLGARLLMAAAATDVGVACGEDRLRNFDWGMYAATDDHRVVLLCPIEQGHQLEPTRVVASLDDRPQQDVLGMHYDSAGQILWLIVQAFSGRASSQVELWAWGNVADIHTDVWVRSWALPSGRRWASGLCVAGGKLLVAAEREEGAIAIPELLYLDHDVEIGGMRAKNTKESKR